MAQALKTKGKRLVLVLGLLLALTKSAPGGHRPVTFVREVPRKVATSN